MKSLKRITAALAALILCLSMSVSALATDTDTDTAQVSPPPQIDFEGKSWEDIMAELLSAFSTTENNVAAGYINLSTGEEYYLNADKYMCAASMFKLPLNMYFVDTVLSADKNWGENHPGTDFVDLRNRSLIESSNDASMELMDILGGYTPFRQLTAEYMGCKAEDLDSNRFINNEYTPRQFIQCLKLLYNESERFPEIIDTLKIATPNKFFQLHDKGIEVPHKFGFISEPDRFVVNDCGIALGEEPIALVMMTLNVPDAEGLLAAYCSTMVDYSQYLRDTKATAEEPEFQPLPESQPLYIKESPVPETQVEESKPFPFVAVAALLLFFIVSMVIVISLCVKYHIRFFWLFICLILTVATIGLSIVGVHMGTVYAKPSGDPGLAAEQFLGAICDGNYSEAYSFLRDYSDLGLEKEPQTEAAKLAYQALHDSFSYELRGECSTQMLEARQPCCFTYLDLPRMEEAIVTETPNQLRKLVAALPTDKIYDENRNFLPEITERAYLAAVNRVLENAESYYTTIEMQLNLSYSNGKWQVLANPALLKALNGGAGY